MANQNARTKVLNKGQEFSRQGWNTIRRWRTRTHVCQISNWITL